MVQIDGSYVHQKSEDFEAYLSAVGLPWVARKAAANTSPTVEISKDGDEWTLSIKTSIMSQVVKFVIGKEFEEKGPGGNVRKSVASMEGENLMISSKTEKGEMRRTLVFTDEGMTMNMHAVAQDVKCKRIFKRS
eukprot:TRINITY_DN1595_c0_g1_i2.p1 TRINITY_DN1595_c0_g1~~TRINITY_DN1595_c0_g1_i2.p1  ORF type:complete len:149 (+),score=45.26 TRINITY_DN1595_c0_g1_i2:46-447(+)